jgi:thiosulfate dehydrogenase (quinone) large subunit
MMLQKETRTVLAVIQALIGFEWLVSGTNKVLSGAFPQRLADTLGAGLGNNPNAWYVGFLHTVVLPHSVVIGYLIETTEVALGLTLVAGALALVGRPRPAGEPQHRTAAVLFALAALAGMVGAFLCVNFHFWMGDGIVPTLNSGAPFDEGLDLDTLLPPLALLVAYGNLRMLDALLGRSTLHLFAAHLRRLAGVWRRRLPAPRVSSQQ